MSLLELRDGRITRETIYFDNADFPAQVGALPAIPAMGTPASGTPVT